MRVPLQTVSDCSDCGACCTGQAALPIHLVGHRKCSDGQEDPFQLPAVSPLSPKLEAELHAVVERFDREGWPLDGTPCIWYDEATKRCRHYEHRPTLCRDEVLPGDDACRRWRRSQGIDQVRRFKLFRGRARRVD